MSSSEKRTYTTGNENGVNAFVELMNDKYSDLFENVTSRISDQELVDFLKKIIVDNSDKNTPQKKKRKIFLGKEKVVTIIEDLSTNEIEDIQAILDEQAKESLMEFPSGSKENESQRRPSKDKREKKEKSDVKIADNLIDESNVDENSGEIEEEGDNQNYEPMSSGQLYHDFDEDLKGTLSKNLLIKDTNEKHGQTNNNISDDQNSKIEGSELTNEVQRNITENVSKNLSNQDLTDSENLKDALSKKIFFEYTNENHGPITNNISDEKNSKEGSELMNEIQKDIAENVSKNVSNHDLTDSLKNQINFNNVMEQHDGEIDQNEMYNDGVKAPELDDMIEFFKERIDKLLVIEEHMRKLDDEKQKDDVKSIELDDMIELFTEHINQMLVIEENIRKIADDSLIETITKSKELNTSKADQIEKAPEIETLEALPVPTESDLVKEEENLDIYFDKIIDEKLKSATKTETEIEQQEENTDKEDEKNEEVKSNIDHENLHQEIERDIDTKYNIMVQDVKSDTKSEEISTEKLAEENSPPKEELSPIPIAETTEKAQVTEKKEEKTNKEDVKNEVKTNKDQEKLHQEIDRDIDDKDNIKVQDTKAETKSEKIPTTTLDKGKIPPEKYKIEEPLPIAETEILTKNKDKQTTGKEEKAQIVDKKEEPIPISKPENTVTLIESKEQKTSTENESQKEPKSDGPQETIQSNEKMKTSTENESKKEPKSDGPQETIQSNEKMKTSTENESKKEPKSDGPQETIQSNEKMKTSNESIELETIDTEKKEQTVQEPSAESVDQEEYNSITMSILIDHVHKISIEEKDDYYENLSDGSKEDESTQLNMEINMDQEGINSDINIILNDHLNKMLSNEEIDSNNETLTESSKEKSSISAGGLKEVDMEINVEVNSDINKFLNDQLNKVSFIEERDTNNEFFSESSTEMSSRSKDIWKEVDMEINVDQKEENLDINEILNCILDGLLSFDEETDDDHDYLIESLKEMLVRSEIGWIENLNEISEDQDEENLDINNILNDQVDRIPSNGEAEESNKKDNEKVLGIEPETSTTDQQKTTQEESKTPKTMSLEEQIDTIIDEELRKEETPAEEIQKEDVKTDTEIPIEEKVKGTVEDKITRNIAEADKKEDEKSKTLIEKPKENLVEDKITRNIAEADKKEDEKSKTLIEKPKENVDEEQKITDEGQKEISGDEPKKKSDELQKEPPDEVKSKTSDKTLKETPDEEQIVTPDEQPNKKSDEKPNKVSGETYPAGFCIQDDVRFLKFIANLNKIDCTCNRAGNDFVLEDLGSDRHKKGCPSSLAPRDVESVKVIFLTKHLPVCRRFLTADERLVLRNILRTAPYYQLEFYVRHSPYEIRCDGEDLVKPHMLDERTFPKRDEQQDAPPKNKKAILDDLKDLLKLDIALDPNQGRFPAEEYKFGEKYGDKDRKRPVDINEYPFGYPTTSTKPANTDILDERLILNLLNDQLAWRYFTSICLCDVIESFDGCDSPCDPAVERLRAVLMARVPAEEQKPALAMVDRNLRFFDDLMRRRLREKIEQEREHMQILREGKRKKEALFVEILSLKSKQAKKTNREEELSSLVNEMFRELIRNNQEIAKDMESKMRRDDALMQRDVTNQLKRLVTRGELKLGSKNNEIFEGHIQETLHNRLGKANDLIRSELEYELDRSNEASLRLFQEVLNQVGQHQEYEDINQYFKNLYPTPDRTLSEQFDSVLNEPMKPWPKNWSEEKSGPAKVFSPRQLSSEEKPEHRSYSQMREYGKPSDVSIEQIVVNVSPVNIGSSQGKAVQTDDSIEQTMKNVPDNTEVKEVRDANTQTSLQSTPKQRSESATKQKSTSAPKQKSATAPQQKSADAPLDQEIDRLMATLWNNADDRVGLIRGLANELRRHDLCEESPKEKAMATKQSYQDFKEEFDSKVQRSSANERRSVSPKRKSRTSPTPGSSKRSPLPATGHVTTLADQEFQYVVIEMPMANQKLEVYHDSFYGPRKTLAEINISADYRQIRTDIEMKN